MSKVLVTEQYLIDIANAVRSKLGVETKFALKDLASQILAIQTSAAPVPEPEHAPVVDDTSIVTIEDTTITEGQLTKAAKQNGVTTIILPNVTQINADCGTLESPSKHITVIFKKQVTIKTDGFEYANNVTYRFESGIKSITSNVFYDATNITLEIVGTVPKGSPWGGNSKQIIIKTIEAPTAQNERPLLGTITINATADGKLTGYTLARLNKCIPNHSKVRFEAILSCPQNVSISTSEGFAIGDFTNGRAWSEKNAFAGPSSYTTKKTTSGTDYILSWDEDIDVSTYVWDDDKANDLLTYYLCGEMSVTGSGEKEKTTLKFSAYK